MLQIPGAWVALKIGGTRVFGYGVLLTSLLAILTPIAARYHVMALIGVRIFQGLFLVSLSITQPETGTVFSSINICLIRLQGVTFPCNHAIWSKWAPPLERSSLITISIAGYTCLTAK